MADGNGILVIGEMAGNEPASTTLEALAAGLSLLASLPGEKLSVVLAGASTAAAAQVAIAHGAQTAYTIEDASLADPAPEAVVAAAQEAVRQASPRIVLGSKTILGRDVLPRLAFRLGTALAQDCTAVAIDDAKRLLATRPVYGGNAVATVACVSDIAVAALRAKSIDAGEPDSSRTGEVVALSVDLASAVRVRPVDRVEQTAEGIRLEDARVVISGGRGLGGPEPFKELGKLAALLGGAVGASRAACDAGWVPSSYQVGLTGKTVTPELYIAVGISGASQHMAGCSNSRTIVAINKDAGANIFKDARFGVAGDWQKVLPAFMEQLQELLG
ncbi:MAG: electron transfer flavoprotein subunit alpha/FixB family protein [Chloroflexi bacterium]|nr:electron transfer flavoprotein subunit alpha/FixB family protein [Chloroflexota bacterium]MDA1173124.1 electron transfer flavoprotein subunit alpha/FixB family protein [Chloroflexota bacterium]